MSGKSRMNGKKGLTGIETAIILVAFVIVAATFAFAVLNVGFQSTQKAQDVIRAGMEQASSAIELDGGVIAYKNESAANDVVANVTFTVRLSPGRTAVDMHSDFLAIAVTTPNYHMPDVYTNNTSGSKCVPADNNSVAACIFPIIDNGASGFLESGDKFRVVVAFGENIAPGTNNEVTIELKPAIGNVLTVQRTTPLVLTDVMFLG